MDMEPNSLTLGQRVLYGFALWLLAAIIVINIAHTISLAIFVALGLAVAWGFAGAETRQNVRERRMGGHDVGQILRGCGQLMTGFPKAALQLSRAWHTAAQHQDVPEQPNQPMQQTRPPAPTQSAPAAPVTRVKRQTKVSANKAPTAKRPEAPAPPEGGADSPFAGTTQPGRERVGYREDGSPYIF